MKNKFLVIGVIAVFALAFSGFYSGNVDAAVQDEPVVDGPVEFGLDATVTAKCLNGSEVTCTGKDCSSQDAHENDDGSFSDGSCMCDLDNVTNCPSPLKK